MQPIMLNTSGHCSTNLLTDDALNALLVEPDVVQDNFCTECNTPMEIAGSECFCARCGAITPLVNDTNYERCGVDNNVKIFGGTNRGKFYNVGVDYSKTQKRSVLQQLTARAMEHTGPAIPPCVIAATVAQYNKIQKLEFDDGKSFVRRGTIKKEILAEIINQECIRVKADRKKKDIALFMGLTTEGFSRGTNILRQLEAEGKIKLFVENTNERFIDRYLEALNIENPTYRSFIIDLVEETERYKLGMSSQISSKIVGSIWLIICRCKLGITCAQLERVCDNTKKNTFCKFYNLVMSNVETFRTVFEKHGIPCPQDGTK